ncbi:MAG: hypothetical protein E7040_02770 [Lentisphaerae bacterium]|nr:hypothetical protein [Lentisphaerota bacterium]
MKKSIILLALVGSCTLFAQTLVNDPCTAKFYAKGNTPSNWYVQTQKAERVNVTYKNLGTNKRTIRIAPKKDQILFFNGSAIKSAKGDVITVTVKAKGKGPFSIGYLSYAAKESNNFSCYEPVQLTDKEQIFTKTFEIKDNANGRKTEVIRICVLAKAGADVEISSVKASMEE